MLAGQLFGLFGDSGDDGSGGGETEAPGPTVLISNDRSAPRRTRLRRVLEEFLPAELVREPAELPNPGSREEATLRAVCVSGADAAQWGKGAAAPRWSLAPFHRILIDAPCSSERHFLHGSPGAVWSRARLKRDAELQGQILNNAARMLAVGGRLVYSTCSLADVENDGVVSRLLAHRRHGAGLFLADALGGALAEPSLAALVAGACRTSCGAIMLPDQSRFGPLYWAVIERRAPATAAAHAEDVDSDEERTPMGSGRESDDDGDGDDDEATGEEGEEGAY